jgi:hypothetical protein
MNSDLNNLKKSLNAFRIKYTVQLLSNTLCNYLTVFFLISAFFTALFALFPWVVLPPVWDISIVAFVVLLVWKIVDYILIHPVSLHDIATIIELRSSLPHLLLSIALEFEKADHANSFTRDTFSTAVTQLSKIPRKSALPKISHVPKGLLGSSFTLWIILLFFCHPSLPDFWRLPLTLLQDKKVSIFPGSVRLPPGNSVTLKLVPSEAPLPSSRLTIFTENNQKRNSLLLKPDTNGAYTYPIDKLEHSIIYQFSYGGSIFKPETVKIVPPPMIMGLYIRAIPPAYMQLKELQFNDEWGDVSVPAGSDVSISVISSELSKAKFLTGTDSLEMALNKDTASIGITLKNDLSYSFLLKNVFGTLNDSLPSFHITMQPDEFPFVQILRPARNKTLNVEQIETLWVDAVDDFGIRSLYCQWYTTSNRELSSKKIGPQIQGPLCKTEYIWDLKGQSLYPGDTLYYWVKVQDTRPDIAQVVSSDTFTLRLPGFEEIQQNIAENGEYVSEKLSEVQNKQDDMRDKLKSITKNKTGSEEASWEQKHAVQDVKKEFESQADTLQKALDALQESVAKLRDEGVLNDEILQKMQEIEKTLKDLIAQYGDSLMKMPDESDRQLSMNDMKDAIQKTQEMLPELEDRLDNTLKYLELLKKDQELAMMAAQAEKFAKEQLDLKQQQSSPEFKEKQKSLMNRIGSFSDSLKQKMKNDAEVGKALDKIDKTSKQMQTSTENEGKPQDEEMSQMSNSLMDLASGLRQKMSSEKMKQMQILRATLLSLATDLFTIIDWNTQIAASINKDPDKEIALSHQALIQSIHLAQEKIDTLKSMPPQMQQLLRNQFGEVYRISNGALKATGAPDALFAMLSEEQSLRDLTEGIVSILENMSNRNNSSSGSGGMSSLMDQLQKLSGKQSAINSAVSEMLRSMMSGQKPGSECKNGNGDKPGGMSESQAKARRDAENAQRALADQLNELAKKFGKEGSGEGSSMSKRMEELEKEARQLAERLRNPPDATLRDRQDRFLSRMLQATLSMHRQDEGKEERKSKSAATMYTDDNPGTVLSDIKNNPDAFYSLRRRALESSFPASYRTAIKNYFDSLGVIYLKK